MHLRKFLTALWALTRPYWASEQRAKGVWLLLCTVGLTLGIVYVNVRITAWSN